MDLIIKIFLTVFVLFIVGITALVMIRDVEIPQHSVVKTIPNETILTDK